MDNLEVEPIVPESGVEAPPGDQKADTDDVGGRSEEGQPLPSVVASTGDSSQAIKDVEEQEPDVSEVTDSERETVVDVRKRRRYPYAAMVFIMTAVVGQRYIYKPCAPQH